MVRFYNRLSLPVMNNIFKLRVENPYNVRHVSEFSSGWFREYIMELKVFHKYFTKLWDISPEKLKNIENYRILKRTLKHGNLITARVGCAKNTLRA